MIVFTKYLPKLNNYYLYSVVDCWIRRKEDVYDVRTDGRIDRVGGAYFGVPCSVFNKVDTAFIVSLEL